MACFATPYGLHYAAHCFNRAYAQNNRPALIPAGGKLGVTSALLKTAMLLLGGWAENRLRKLAYEPNGFAEAERAILSSKNTQLETWQTALELGFRKRHNIPNANLATALPLTARAHFQALKAVIDQELRPIIEVRNKLAHGQWARALNNENTDFSALHNQQIAAENAHTLRCKKRILESMAQLIHDLNAGNHAFERDFDRHYSKLEMARISITSRSYQDWLNQMREKYRKGKDARTRSGQ